MAIASVFLGILGIIVLDEIIDIVGLLKRLFKKDVNSLPPKEEEGHRYGHRDIYG